MDENIKEPVIESNDEVFGVDTAPTEEKKKHPITSMEFICPLYHERLRYFLCEDVFPSSELENNSFIDKYRLDSRYRDLKLVDRNGFPPGYPVDNVTFGENGLAWLISIRAMHRIAVADLVEKDIHFMFDDYVRWHMYDYDNQHGALIKFMVHDKFVPEKYTFGCEFRDRPNEFFYYKLVHIESVWNLDGKPGFLLYYITENNKLSSFYIDGIHIKNFTLTFNPHVLPKLIQGDDSNG